jgi:hypothetical protein
MDDEPKTENENHGQVRSSNVLFRHDPVVKIALGRVEGVTQDPYTVRSCARARAFVRRGRNGGYAVDLTALWTSGVARLPLQAQPPARNSEVNLTKGHLLCENCRKLLKVS